MKITDKTLDKMSEAPGFVSVFSEFSKFVFSQARLYPSLSDIRTIDAHGAWINDLSRVTKHEKKLTVHGMDHFKRCGHLAFWLRRMSPIVEAVDLTANPGDAEGYPLTQQELTFRDLLFGYHNEYIAFDLGFQICRFYETKKETPSRRAENLVLSVDYYKTTCHFLKYKTVSPHAMYLIYHSLFHQ